MKSSADVVVIGAGIIGTSIAYHLAKKGVRDVVVVEMDLIGSGSSGRSAAMIMLQMSREGTIKMSQESFKEYLTFDDEFEAHIDFNPIGYLNLATPEIADELRGQVELQRQMGVPIEILSPDELQRMIPALNVEDVVFGALARTDGTIDPHGVMQGYARAARRLGVQIEEKVQATGLVIRDGQIEGVETTAGMIATHTVVNAAGARAVEVGAWVGLKLPIRNFQRHIFITDQFPEIPRSTPFVMDLAVEWYFRKEGEGSLLGMGLEESASFDPVMNWDFLETIVARAMHRAPILANARVIRGWAGLRPLTPDDYPILGSAPNVADFINACGFGGHGVMHAPIGGILIAELIADGHTTTLPLEPFRLERFEGM
jgi:sarcosine oxidase subunit beta